MSQEQTDLATFIIEGILLTTISIFGLIGNILSIVVLTRNIKQSNSSGSTGPTGPLSSQKSFSIFLRTLACFDALFLTSAILAFGLPRLSTGFSENLLFVQLMGPLFGCIHIFRTGVVYSTLAVTYERFQSVVRPLGEFRHKRYVITAIVVSSTLYNIPKFFEVTSEVDPQTQKIVMASTSLRRNQLYISLYIFWSKFILVEMIPYTLIIFMNAFMILKISKSGQFRKTFGRRSLQADTISAEEDCNNQMIKENRNLTVILIAMSVLFVSCQSLKIVPDLYEIFACHTKNPQGGGRCEPIPAIEGILRISHLMVCCNSSANFLIYYMCGSKFRNAWNSTYGPIWQKIWNLCLSSRHQENTATESQIALKDFKTQSSIQENCTMESRIDILNAFKSKYGPTLV